MTVRKEKRGDRHVWVLDILYRKDGKRRRYRRDAQVQTGAAARAEERRLLAELGDTGDITTTASPVDPTPIASADVTFDDAVKRFFDQKAESTLKPSSRVSYREVTDRVLVPAFGGKPLEEIVFTAVASVDADLARDGLGASSRRNVHVVLRSILRFAVESGLLDVFPKLPKLPKVGRKVLRVLTRSEIDRVLVVASPTARLAFALSAFAGLRAGEVRGLSWGDVDLPGRALTVRLALSHGELAPPKSGHERSIPLAGRLADLLREAKPKRAAPHDRVALTKHGKVWGTWGLGLAFQRAQIRAGIAGFRFHDLRHFFVTQLFRDGAPAPAVQQLAGHHSLQVTQWYAHMVSTDLRAAIDRLECGNSVETGAVRGE